MFALRDVDDLDRIVEALPPFGSGGHAVVAGGGFIGLEAVENLRARGMNVTLVTRGPQVLPDFDPEMAGPVARRLGEAGVEVRLGTEIERVRDGVALLSDGSRVPAGLVFAAVGVEPESALPREAGITLGTGGAVRVDGRQRTSADGVWAVGDVAEKHRGDRYGIVSFAGLANREGRLAADDIAGIPRPAVPALGTAIVASCGVVAARTGRGETELRAEGRTVRVVHTHPTDHAGYYPGAERMSMKLIVDPGTDRILGAQIVGGNGVDKRMDVLATAMAAGMTATALADLELSYAPQFGSAKDPVNMLGYIDGNMARGDDPTIQWWELAERVAEGWRLVDVRMGDQLTEGSIPGSLHIPLTELRDRLDELRGERVVVHCRVGQNSHNAQRLMLQSGIETVNLDGGFLTWRDAGAPPPVASIR